MISFKCKGRLTAINGSREEPSRVWLRILPESAKTDFYAEGVQPAEVIMNTNNETVRGIQFGDEVEVTGNLSYGVSERQDRQNPNKTWENYRTYFQIQTIKKV